MKISIVIPAYNEEKTLYELVQKVHKIVWNSHITSYEIVLVDDGSKDNTLDIMQTLARESDKVKVVQNPKNMGKSQTVKNGILQTDGDLVVVQDADFEYVPQEINLLVEELISKELDVVYGNRFGKKNKVIYWQNFFGNKLVSFISNLFTYPRIRKYIPDMEVCYKLIQGKVFREIAKNIKSTSNFGVEPEVTAKLAKYRLDKRKLKFGVVPISYFPRTIAEGKKMKAFRDGFKAVGEIVKFNLFSQV